MAMSDLDGRGRRIEGPMLRARDGSFADEWAAKGLKVGKIMHKHEEEGYCVKCSFFKKEQLSKRMEAEFNRTWGSDGSDIAKDMCSVPVDDFFQKCPMEEA